MRLGYSEGVKCSGVQNAIVGIPLSWLFALSGIAECQGSVEWSTLPPAVIQQRLEMVRFKTSERHAVLKGLFQDAGCHDLTDQPVPHEREGNLICTLEGKTDSVIVVGAHFDADYHGMGAVDDWSGAALLPTIYQSLNTQKRRHKIVFVAFSGEETGSYGSKTYVARLSTEEKLKIRAMVNLECLGVAAAGLWGHRADKLLYDAYVQVSASLQMQPRSLNIEQVGLDDSFSFSDAKIPTITIHSVTQETWPILHTSRDKVKAIKPDQYSDAYRLIVAYIASIDAEL
jgi:Iap family predicted aminopeptidase